MSTAIPELSTFDEQELDQAFAALTAEVQDQAKLLTNEEAIEAFRLNWLGRKQGRLGQISAAWLKSAPVEAKKSLGMRFNKLKTLVEEQRAATGDPETRAIGALDVTLPGTTRRIGAEHPLIKTMAEIVSVFQRMGYSVGLGPEVENDFNNFESLNFPPNHPARDTQDTIFIAGQESKPQRDRLLLRTHTSPVQTRAMEKHRPPIRVVAPGKVHRSDTPDASHSPIFHQVEGLAVDTNITFSDLKGTLDHAMKELFGSDVKTRFFPSFFPFTEPSADVQVTCFKCGGKGCRLCKMSGWIELLGCGMVNPKVLAFHKDNGYDPEKVSGFAFGMGVERIAMLKYGIDDIQLFFHGDVRFLEQFA